jgi:hypothetical protein
MQKVVIFLAGAFQLRLSGFHIVNLLFKAFINQEADFSGLISWLSI